MKISKSLSNISIIAVHDKNVYCVNTKISNSLLMWCYFVNLAVLGVGGRIRYWWARVEDGYETKPTAVGKARLQRFPYPSIHEENMKFSTSLLLCKSCDCLLNRPTVVGISILCAQYTIMTDKRKNADVANTAVGAVKSAKLAPTFRSYLKASHLLEMSQDDKRYLHFAWRRFESMARTQEAPVLQPFHLLSMDIQMLQFLLVEWNDLQLHKSLRELDEIREAQELEYHQQIALEMEYIDHDDFNS